MEKPVFKAEFVENRQIFFSHTKCPTSMKKLRYRLLISVNGKWVKLSNTFNSIKKTPCIILYKSSKNIRNNRQKDRQTDVRTLEIKTWTLKK